MLESASLDPPRKGDPITADWAAALTAAVNAGQAGSAAPGAQRLPSGVLIPAAPSPDIEPQSGYPMPFDSAIYRSDADADDKLLMFLPSAGASYVWAGASPLGPAQGQSVGDSNSAWVEVETLSHGTPKFVYLAFHADQNDEPDGWRIHATSTADAIPGWACTKLPMILLVRYNVPADGATSQDDESSKPSGQEGLIQMYHGSVAVSTTDDSTCPDVYSVTEKSGTGLPECVDKRYEFKRQKQTLDNYGNCVDATGTGSSITTNIDIPKPPEYSLSVVTYAGERSVTLQRTPCGGQAAQAGDTVSIPLLNGTFVTSIDTISISSNALVLTYTTTTYQNGVADNPTSNTVSIPVTSC